MMTDLKIKVLVSGRKQVEISKETGIDRQRLNMILNGWTTGRPEEIKRIKEVIDGKAE